MNKETTTMNTMPHPAVGRIGPYRAIHLSRILDPATEKRRCALRRYSHSIVAGGLELMSYTTRFTPRTSLMIRPEMVASTS